MSERRPPDPTIVDSRDRPPESRSDRAREELDSEVGTTSISPPGDLGVPAEGVVAEQGSEARAAAPDQARMSSAAAGDDPHTDREAPNEDAARDPEGTGRYRTSDTADGEPGV